MGTGDDPRHARETRRFDSEELARLRRDAGLDPADRAEPPPPPLSSRTTTAHDPMTMALLAEVARASRTMEVDEDTLAQAKADADVPVEAHPRVKRR